MSGLAERYRELVAAGELKPDPDQRNAVVALDRIAAALARAADKNLLSRLLG